MNFVNRRSIKPSKKWQRILFALTLICLLPCKANSSEQNWRQQLNDIGPGVSQPVLIEKRLVLSKALEVSEKTKRSDFPEYAAIVIALADIYVSEGELKKAERCLSDAASLIPYPSDDKDPIKFPSGLESPNMVATINRRLGWLETRSKHYEFASKSYALAQRIWYELGGESTAKVAGIKNDMAVLEYQRGDYNKASQLFSQAMEVTDSITKQSVFATKKWKANPKKKYHNMMSDLEKNALMERSRSLEGYAKALSKLGRTAEAENATRDSLELERFLKPIKMWESESALSPPSV